MMGAIAIGAIVLVVNSPTLSSRIANVATVLTRFSLWNESVGVWLAHPLTGVGPGGFPFSYQLSDHFRNSLFDPRHPDNAVIQVLVEAGLLGLAAAAICVTTLVLGARTRLRSEPCAVWALLFFAFTTFGANPTDFLFLVAPAVVWASFLVPSDSRLRNEPSPSIRSSKVTTGLLRSGNVIIAAAVLAMAAASASYQIGWMAYQRGDVAGAASALDLAITLDPSLAIYRRERGSLAFAAEQWDQAARLYGEGLSINRYDSVAWRGLALTELQLSEPTASVRAAKAATDLMFLSPQNQIVLAAVGRDHPSVFEQAMRTALEQAPQLAVVSWDGTILGFADRVAVTKGVVGNSSREVGSNVSFGRLLLAVLTARPDVAEAAMRGVPQAQRLSAFSLASFAACDLDAADNLIDDASKTEGEFPSFWIARSVISAATGHDHQRIVAIAVRVLRLPSGSSQELVASALAGDRSDAWRYRRIALGVRSPLAGLPSSGAGLSLLISDPATAFSSLGTNWPPACH
jgi:tetratricopeptide (TPR) repeat protein